MKKISTLKKTKITQKLENAEFEKQYTDKPSEQAISNILNFSKALEVKKNQSGFKIEIIRN